MSDFEVRSTSPAQATHPKQPTHPSIDLGQQSTHPTLLPTAQSPLFPDAPQYGRSSHLLRPKHYASIIKPIHLIMVHHRAFRLLTNAFCVGGEIKLMTEAIMVFQHYNPGINMLIGRPNRSSRWSFWFDSICFGSNHFTPIIQSLDRTIPSELLGYYSSNTDNLKNLLMKKKHSHTL